MQCAAFFQSVAICRSKWIEGQNMTTKIIAQPNMLPTEQK